MADALDLRTRPGDLGLMGCCNLVDAMCICLYGQLPASVLRGLGLRSRAAHRMQTVCSRSLAQAEAAAATAAAEAAAASAGLWTGLMDAAAAWDVALLPLLGAGGPAAEAAAARAGALLEGYARAGDGGGSGQRFARGAVAIGIAMSIIIQ